METRSWRCQTCGEPQQTIDWPEHQFCPRCDLFTHVDCVICGKRTTVTPAELYLAGRLNATHAKCVLLDKGSGEEVADVQSLRSRDDSPAGSGLSGEGGGRAQRDADARAGSLAGGGLGDSSADSDSGAPGLERGEPGDTRGDLSGAQVALASGRKVSVQQRATIVDGQGAGSVGEVVEIKSSQFGHIYVTLEGDDGTRQTTLETKVERV
jgi:hypothetical protein